MWNQKQFHSTGIPLHHHQCSVCHCGIYCSISAPVVPAWSFPFGWTNVWLLQKQSGVKMVQHNHWIFGHLFLERYRELAFAWFKMLKWFFCTLGTWDGINCLFGAGPITSSVTLSIGLTALLLTGCTRLKCLPWLKMPRVWKPFNFQVYGEHTNGYYVGYSWKCLPYLHISHENRWRWLDRQSWWRSLHHFYWTDGHFLLAWNLELWGPDHPIWACAQMVVLCKNKHYDLVSFNNYNLWF